MKSLSLRGVDKKKGLREVWNMPRDLSLDTNSWK